MENPSGSGSGRWVVAGLCWTDRHRRRTGHPAADELARLVCVATDESGTHAAARNAEERTTLGLLASDEVIPIRAAAWPW
jgi:hypothetical protein